MTSFEWLLWKSCHCWVVYTRKSRSSKFARFFARMGGTPFIAGVVSPFLVPGHLPSAAWIGDVASMAPRKIAPDHTARRLVVFTVFVLSVGFLPSLRRLLPNEAGVRRSHPAAVYARIGAPCSLGGMIASRPPTIAMFL